MLEHEGVDNLALLPALPLQRSILLEDLAQVCDADTVVVRALVWVSARVSS